MTRLVLYVAAPLAPTRDQIDGRRSAFGLADDKQPAAAALQANIERAMRWLWWLRRSFREVTFVAPWIAAVLAGEDDADPAQREAGLVDADAIVPRCDGIVLVGGRVSIGMARERGRARRVWDLTPIGKDPPDCDIGRPAWLEWGEVFETRPFCPEHGADCAGPACCCADLHRERGAQADSAAEADLAPAASSNQDASNRRNDAAAESTAPADQPPPIPNTSTPIIERVLADLDEVASNDRQATALLKADMSARSEVGRERYGVYLQAHNGRDALADAYQEAQDLVMYLRQRIEEVAETDHWLESSYGTAMELARRLARRVHDGPGRRR